MCVVVCVCVCPLRYRLNCVNGSLRLVSCHGTLHGHNRGRCELQNGAKLDLLGSRLDYLDLWKYLGSFLGRLGKR